MAENDENTGVGLRRAGLGISRSEHLDWCKGRALEYLDRGDLPNAIASMLSDLGKHDDTKDVGRAMTPMGVLALMNQDQTEARRFIKGFN